MEGLVLFCGVLAREVFRDTKKAASKMIPLFYNYLDRVTVGKHEPLGPEHPGYWLMKAIREKLVTQASSMSA